MSANDIWTKLPPPENHPAPTWRYFGLSEGSTLLSKGHQRFPGKRALPCEIIWERDTPVVMRDGVKLRTDIFRSTDEKPVPVVIMWGAYGKTGAGALHIATMAPFGCGLKEDQLSGYEKFEGLDPAEWIPRGYAIANPDCRGAFDSEGDASFWGQQDAEDVYDYIEWLHQQPWCNGSVCMAGNSMLAMSQLNHAARCPHPALKCIAPWEAVIDPYRDTSHMGGTTWLRGFNNMIFSGFAGRGKVENIAIAGTIHQLYDEFWKSKRIPVEKIEIPTYGLGSYSSQLHTHGSFETFRKVKTPRKWLRIHDTFEWYDIYQKANEDDLQRFYDFYTKQIDNGWERDTPPLRLTLLGYDEGASTSIVERPEQEWPLQRTKYLKLHLHANSKKMFNKPSQEVASAEYQSDDINATLDFTFEFGRYTELAGYSKVRLNIACGEANDMDVVVQLRKIGRDGTILSHVNYPVPVPKSEVPQTNVAVMTGPQGALRASHAPTYDTERSTEAEPAYKHDRSEALTPGKIVTMDIPIWPWGATFEAGEGVMLRVSGHNMRLPETLRLVEKEIEQNNTGRHTVHTGGQHDSYLLLPIVN